MFKYKNEFHKECSNCKERHLEKRHIDKYRYISPLISVIIPSRIGEEILSLKTLKEQTYKNIEIIIEYDEKQEGASVVRNRGAKKAKGEYLFFCDNDLELESDCLKNLLAVLKENPSAGWAFGRFIIDEREFNVNKGEKPKNKFSKEYVDYFQGVSTMSLIRKSCNPVFDEERKRYNDWDLWIRLDRAGYEPVFCNKILFKTKKRPNGITQKSVSREWLNSLYDKHLKNKIADIIIPHHNRHDLLKKCLENLSDDFFNVIIISGGTFSQNCNKGARLAETDNLIFLNDDVIPDINILLEMCSKKEGIIGVSQIVPEYRNKIIYGLGLRFIGNNEKNRRFFAFEPEKAIIPSGFCWRIKKSIWDELGGFNEEFRNDCEDSDFSLRALEKNIEIGFVNKPVFHFHRQSICQKSDNKNYEIFDKYWDENRLKSLLNKLKEKDNIKERNDILIRINNEGEYCGEIPNLYNNITKVEYYSSKILKLEKELKELKKEKLSVILLRIKYKMKNKILEEKKIIKKALNLLKKKGIVFFTFCVFKYSTCGRVYFSSEEYRKYYYYH